MNGNGKVSVPAHKAPAPGGNSAIAKSGSTRGFGGGHGGNTVASQVSVGAAKRSVRGFSGSGVKGGKI